MVLFSFIAATIESDKDFDPHAINEFIISRVNRCDFDELKNAFQNHISSNEMNGAKYAIAVIERLQQ